MNDQVTLARRPSWRGRLVALGAVLLALSGCTAPAEPRSDSIRNPSEGAVDVTAAPVDSTGGAGGWIAFAADWPGYDLRLVRPGEPAHRILASEDDVARRCPAFDPQGGRLAFGVAKGSDQDGWTDVALGTALVTDEGSASVLEEVVLDGFEAPPCPVWSPRGDTIAIGTQSTGPSWRGSMDAIVLVDPETAALRRIDDVDATDFEWSPDGSRLYIADASGILAYSVADAELSVVDDTPLGSALTVSPDGESLAVERRKINAAERYELWLMGTDGSDARVVAEDYAQIHGLGPVWAPDGDHVVYQRSCSTLTSASGTERPCREEHEVVVLTVSEGDPTDPLGAQRIIAPPRTDDEARPWFPYSVTWSPDSSQLLYLGWTWEPDDEAYADGLVAVPLDGSEPLVLYETTAGIDAYPGPPMNNFQSWAG